MYVSVLDTKDSLKFDVMFHDNCRKTYAIDMYDFRATRMSVRDFIENIIKDYYASIGLPDIQLNINFS